MEIPKIKKRFFAYIVRATLLVVLVALGAPALCAVCAAADGENSIIVENYAMIEEYAGKLGEEVNAYTSLDTTDGKSLSKNVSNEINSYRKKMLDLQSHADVGTRSLSEEILLAYAQGSAAGRLAWIYYSNLPELSSDSALKIVQDKQAVLAAEIASAAEHRVLSARADGISTEMNRAIYAERVKALALSTDSLDSASLIAGALEKVSRAEASDLFAESMVKILNELGESLALQRARDSLTGELKSIFSVVRPSESYAENESVALFAYKIKNATTVAEMNEVMRDTLYALTTDGVEESETYLRIYLAELNGKISDRAASSDKAVITAVELFYDFTERSTRAKFKDSIFAVLFEGVERDDSVLSEIEAEFNADGGFVDRQTDLALLPCELTRAQSRRALYDTWRDTVEKTKIILGVYDKASFLERAEAIYSQYNSQLRAKAASASGFGEGCADLIAKAKAAFVELLDEAKAERYLNDHRDIISKELAEIAPTDELVLKNALNDYIALPVSVRTMLKSQILGIAEKYNSFLDMKIRSAMASDALYLELCTAICDEIKKIPLDDIEAYFAKCDRALSKAKMLAQTIEYYRAIVGGSIYQSYTETQKNELSAVCTAFGEQLGDISLGADSFEGALAVALQSAKTKMDRINECVRVEAAARGSENKKIKQFVLDAQARIKASNDKNEMSSVSEAAIFKINRELTADEIAEKCDALKYRIEQLKFLTQSEKNIYADKVLTLKANAVSEAPVAENITVLSFIWTSFNEKLSAIEAEVLQKDLAKAKTEYSALIDKEIEKGKNTILSMAHITEQKRDEYIELCSLQKSAYDTASVSVKSSEELAALYLKMSAQISSVVTEASGANLAEYKKIIDAELVALAPNSEKYSAESAKRIDDIIAESRKRLTALAEIAACNTLLDNAKKDIGEIPDLLDDEKASGRDKLNSLLAEYTAISSLYSQENLATLKRVHSEALLKIDGFKSISELAVLKAYISEAEATMKGVRRELVYTSADALNMSGDNPAYPPEHDFESDGYWGSVHSNVGLPVGTSLSIGKLTSINDINALRDAVRRAAKKNELKIFGTLSAEKLKLLKKCNISLGLDIVLSEALDTNGRYTVTLLLPPAFSEENVLGVVFFDEYGGVEFYDIKSSGGRISFETKHFSSYYIVTEGTVNIMPLIIFLCVMLVLEFAVLALLLIIRYNRRKGEREMLPLLSGFLPTVGALKIQPQNGVGLVVLLSVAVLAVGCAIAVLVRVELKERERPLASRRASGNENMCRELCETRNAGLLRAKKEALAAPREASEYNGGVATCTLVIEEDPEGASEFEVENTERTPLCDHTPQHRVEINLDIIAKKFAAGELVTPERLKEKHLIPRKTDHIKILARGNLAKPLVVEAHDFSRAAEEMLKAVGGEAIRIK